MRVALATHGCRLNQAESDAMIGRLVRAGHQVVPAVEQADVLVLNTCTITHQADADARQAVRRARRANPDVRVVVTGCYANADPAGAAALEGVDAVIGNGDKDRIDEAVERLAAPATGWVDVSSLRRRRTWTDLPAVALPSRRTRALLKVQDGCNYRCAFCIVPAVRGPSRSLSLDELRRQAASLVASGVPEIVLTGIHLGTWGRDLRPRRRLVDLVAGLLPVLGKARLRLSSVDPHEVDDDLVDLMAERAGQICRHLHLPVQSGDPTTLRRMRRGHTAEDLRDLVVELASRVEGICLGTDVIVGFPGEDEAAFGRTRDLLAELPLAYHHVFRYSRRRGTAAAQWPDQVDASVKRARNLELRTLSERSTRVFAERFVGVVLDAVVERGRDGQSIAVTDNYLRLRLPVPVAPGSRLGVRVRPGGTDAEPVA